MTAGVYVATHAGLSAHRIGITDAQAGTDRLRVHERHGWRVVGMVHTTGRAEAERVEAVTLANLRAVGVPAGVTAVDMPQGGHTETVPASVMSAAELLRTVRRTAGQDEDGPEGRLGAVLELLAWARRHLGPAAVETMWETDPDAAGALLLRIASAADDVAAAARAGAEASPGARALRSLEQMVRDAEAVDRRVARFLATAPPEQLATAETRALLDHLIALSEAIAHADPAMVE